MAEHNSADGTLVTIKLASWNAQKEALCHKAAIYTYFLPSKNGMQCPQFYEYFYGNKRNSIVL
jgi:hypothetical protein